MSPCNSAHITITGISKGGAHVLLYLWCAEGKGNYYFKITGPITLKSVPPAFNYFSFFLGGPIGGICWLARALKASAIR